MEFHENRKLCVWRAAGSPEETRRFTRTFLSIRNPKGYDPEFLEMIISGEHNQLRLDQNQERLTHYPGEAVIYSHSGTPAERAFCEDRMSELWRRAREAYTP